MWYKKQRNLSKTNKFGTKSNETLVKPISLIQKATKPKENTGLGPKKLRNHIYIRFSMFFRFAEAEKSSKPYIYIYIYMRFSRFSRSAGDLRPDFEQAD